MSTTVASAKQSDKSEEREAEWSISGEFNRHSNRLRPYVRYGVINENGEFRQRGLTSLSDPIPDGAKTVSSGIYFVPQGITYSGNSIRSIQSRAEQKGNVLYRVLAESDALEKGHEAQQVINWLVELANDWLNIPDSEYTLYYSGNRSIHLHTQRYVIAEDGRKRLKEHVEEFCKELGADLDTGIYQQKGQFRLPGAQHTETELYKNMIDDDYTREDLIRENTQTEKRFSSEMKKLARIEQPVAAEDTVETFSREIENRVLGVHELSVSEHFETAEEEPTVDAPFNPYINAGSGNHRSIILAKQTGEVVELGEKRYVTAYIKQAIGCDGYRRYNHNGHIRLSEIDSRKWCFDEGDWFVMISGRSGRSILHDLTEEERLRESIAGHLSDRYKNSDVGGALDVLEAHGYNTGSSGLHGSSSTSRKRTEAMQIKQEIDSGQRELKHDSVFRVVCRLLKIDGWDKAWNWCKDVYGDDFDPEITYDELEDAVNAYYPDISVPSRDEYLADNETTIVERSI